MNAITQHTHDNENSLNAVGSHATGGNTGSSDDEWVKLNLDSGAAVTAFPESLAPPGCQGNGNNYKTATGELTPDKGQIKITGTSENKRKLRITARVANVHKPLLSASRCVNGGQCVWLSEGGGGMIETTDPVIKQVESILWKHAMQGKPTFIPVYEERGVYNVYVKKEKIEAVNETSLLLFAWIPFFKLGSLIFAPMRVSRIMLTSSFCNSYVLKRFRLSMR